MDEQQTPSPVRQQIDELRQSEAFTDQWHPSHLQALDTISRLYSQEYPDPQPEEAETPTPTDQPSETEIRTEVDPLDNPLTPEEEQGITSLKQEWAGQWEANVTAAQDVVESLSKDLGYDVADFLEDSRLGSDATTIKAMYAWSRGEQGPEIGGAEAQAILDKVRKSALYQKGDSRARDTLLDVVQALYRVVHPEA